MALPFWQTRTRSATRAALFLFLASLNAGYAQEEMPPREMPQVAPEMEMAGLDGTNLRLRRGDRATVVVFIGTECPLARLYASRLEDIVSHFESKISVLLVSSNRQDSIAELREFKAQFGVRFPIAKDFDNRFADALQARRTPEALLLDADLNIRYRGRIDDQYSPGATRPAPRRHFLRDALDNLVKGKPIQVTRTEPVGCLIGRVRKVDNRAKVTYCNQVSRILQKHCVECHREGEIGPFSLTDYEEIVGWSDMILEVVNQQRMPPWHANPEHGDFLNARILSADEKKLLADWVDAGAPFGDPEQLPKPRQFVSGWSLPRQPDTVISMKTAYQVPAEGVVDYQYFVLDPGFKKDQWVSAAQVLPGNPSVVHHSIVFVRPPDGSRFRGIGWLSAYVPGQRVASLPPGHARLIPAGSRLVFQQHYTVNGSPQQDRTRIGLVFADPGKVDHEVLTLAGIEQQFVIPAHAPNYRVSSSVSNLPVRGKLLSISPHMHLRGKSFRAFCQAGDRKRVLCDVPEYDFNWQHSYRFREPPDLSKISDLRFDVTFDNSDDNPVNPDPTQRVTWGDQTYEEMAVAFFDISIPRQAGRQVRVKNPGRKPRSGDAVRQEQKVTEFVTGFFERFDEDGNGLVDREETPLSLGRFGFGRYDANGDGNLTREEVTRAARNRMGSR
ncbi:MAG: redoxin domain-containing protein [Planctomycetota bacterium]|nr:redoxin domain-containing protein [Planctomycetota bacterium]